MGVNQSKCYLVIGATGNVGSCLVNRLAKADKQHEIRCATRNPSSTSAERLRALGTNVVPVQFDAARPENLAAAVAGATHVYLLPPFVRDMEDWHEDVVAALRDAGTVQYIVKHSVMGARAPSPESTPSPVPLMHYHGELAVARSGIPYSVIRPTIFAQHFTLSPWIYAAGADVFRLPIGSAKVAFLDARDIATLACHLLVHADPAAYHERIFQLTGPEAITGEQISGALSAAVNREIRYVDPPEDEFMQSIRDAGVDEFSAEQLGRVYHDCKEGWLGMHLSDDLFQELGQRPTSFEQFARDHAQYFSTSE